MRLVLLYTITDGCTYTDFITLPFEYPSKEQAALDLLALIEPKMNTDTRYQSDDIVFSGHHLNAFDFYSWSEKHGKQVYDEPTILTLDEWWETHSRGDTT